MLPLPPSRAAIAFLAIALQAVDAIVGVAGHSHAHFELCASRECGHSPCHCHHDHAAASDHEEDQPAPPGPSDSQPHDDCALCRHFSQPVAPVAAIAEILGGQRIETHVPRITSCLVGEATTTHPARGPPLFLL